LARVAARSALSAAATSPSAAAGCARARADACQALERARLGVGRALQPRLLGGDLGLRGAHLAREPTAPRVVARLSGTRSESERERENVRERA